MEDRDAKGKFKQGFSHPPRKKFVDVNHAKEKYIEGYSCLDISKKFNVSERTIRNRLKEIGVKLRKQADHTELIKQKIKNTLIRRGIQPKERFSGDPWNKGKRLHYPTWNKGKIGLQKSNKKGKTLEELYGNKEARRIKKQVRERRKTQILPKKDTKIELKIQDFLTALRVEFMTHKYMNIKHSYQCDIFIPEQEGIPQKMVIECDGDFFHMNPNKYSPGDKCYKTSMTAKERWRLDENRTEELIKKGFRVLRLWEFEIKEMDLGNFEEKLNEVTT